MHCTWGRLVWSAAIYYSNLKITPVHVVPVPVNKMFSSYFLRMLRLKFPTFLRKTPRWKWPFLKKIALYQLFQFLIFFLTVVLKLGGYFSEKSTKTPPWVPPSWRKYEPCYFGQQCVVTSGRRLPLAQAGNSQIILKLLSVFRSGFCPLNCAVNLEFIHYWK